MKKIIGAAFAALLFAITLAPKPAPAMDRTQWLFGMNPPSSWMNYEERYTRLGFGQLIFDALGRTTSGLYSNLSVQTSGGLTVVVGPANANTVGSLYQYLAEEVSTFGGPGGTALATDPNQVYLQGLIYGGSTTAAIGPLTAGTSSGQSINNLIECKVLTLDQTSQTGTFVSALGVVTSSAVNRDRADTVSCQNKAGTSATTGSQVVPTVDAGWVAIGYVAVANGVSTITGGMITAQTGQQFNGFLQPTVAGAAAIDTSSTAQTKAGALTIVGASTNGIAIGGSFSNSTPAIANDNSAVNGLNFSVPSSATNGYRFFTGTSPTLIAQLSASGTFTATQFSGSGAGLTSGTIPLSAMVTTPLDLSTANQVVTVPKTFSGSTSFGARVVLTTAPVNGLYLTPASDTQSGTMVITNAAASNNLLNFTQVSSTAGQLNVVGNLVSWEGGTYSNPGSATGDIVAQRSNAGGVIFLGGSGSSGSLDWNVNTSGQFTFRDTGVGYGLVTGGAYTTISDRRLKRNIEPIAYGLDAVMKLKPVSFIWRGNGKHDFGFIAQDVRKVLPELVSSDSKRGYLGVSYAGLSPVFALAIQQQQGEISALSGKLTAHDREIAAHNYEFAALWVLVLILTALQVSDRIRAARRIR